MSHDCPVKPLLIYVHFFFPKIEHQINNLNDFNNETKMNDYNIPQQRVGLGFHMLLLKETKLMTLVSFVYTCSVSLHLTACLVLLRDWKNGKEK